MLVHHVRDAQGKLPSLPSRERFVHQVHIPPKGKLGKSKKDSNIPGGVGDMLVPRRVYPFNTSQKPMGFLSPESSFKKRVVINHIFQRVEKTGRLRWPGNRRFDLFIYVYIYIYTHDM